MIQSKQVKEAGRAQPNSLHDNRHVNRKTEGLKALWKLSCTLRVVSPLVRTEALARVNIIKSCIYDSKF